ncbi:MAG: hypothetical protein KJ905_00980 [Nanoarchaeota archaeon]|nr:hypothetical protein [Nanoarchaeota archaeon]MBU1501333.1 hypothetical protein [Nanoarchaeota archaeon]
MVESISLEQVYQKLEGIELFMKKFEQLAEDMEFARRTEEAIRRHEEGNFTEMDSKDFLKELEKW